MTDLAEQFAADALPTPSAPEPDDDFYLAVERWPDVEWVGDVDSLLSIEQDLALRELGIRMDDVDALNANMVSFMALAAVLIARRRRREIPISAYKHLRLKDMSMPEQVEDSDPTSAA
jgi:hypothetical protein